MQACIKAVFPHNRQGEVGFSLVREKTGLVRKKKGRSKRKRQVGFCGR